MGRRSKYPSEMRERAVRLVFEQQDEHESQRAAITSIAGKMGCLISEAHERPRNAT